MEFSPLCRRTVAGHAQGRGRAHSGRDQAGAWSCGMVAGLIHDVPSVQQLIDSIMAQAHALISERLAGMLR